MTGGDGSGVPALLAFELHFYGQKKERLALLSYSPKEQQSEPPSILSTKK